ncbi:MAG: hypothetical protein ACK4L7_00875, partial [Flavobacteriales bacterium]
MAELIAEIGGTSSRWALLDATGAASILPVAGEAMPGYNPLSGDGAAFARAVAEQFGSRLPIGLSAARIHVYGAGCGTPERAAAMEAAIRQVWPSAAIAVRTDLEGAAIGLCGSEPGLVVILGTGSNAGWWDGAHLHASFPSLGYVLGDEGSGADIGRALLQDAFYKRMPQEASWALFGPGGPGLTEVLDAVYRSPFPSRALAAYAGRLAAVAHHPY